MKMTLAPFLAPFLAISGSAGPAIFYMRSMQFYLIPYCNPGFGRLRGAFPLETPQGSRRRAKHSPSDVTNSFLGFPLRKPGSLESPDAAMINS